jgi:uncharacterized protein (DUF433 family)
MKSNKTKNGARRATKSDEFIHDRGRGPEIKGTRITVYDVLDYALECWPPERIAAWFDISPRQVEAAVDYIREHTIEVLTEFVKILERSARGNPPELQAKLDASHARFRKLVKQVREIKLRADDDIHELIQKHRDEQPKGKTDGRHPSGQ